MSRLRERLSRQACAVLVVGALVASACTRGSIPAAGPSLQPAASMTRASTPLAAGPEDVKRVVGCWQRTPEWVKVPPLNRLAWGVLRSGQELPAHSVIITDAGARVTLQIPATAFRSRFLSLVDESRVLGYQRAGDQIEIEVHPETLFPLRLPPDIVAPGARLRAVAVRVSGLSVRALGSDEVGRRYGALTPHNPPYPARTADAVTPALAPLPVHLKKGLGVRGKNLSSLSPDLLRKMYLDFNDGVYVDAVLPGSPADRVGMQAHDVIRRFGSVAVHDADDLVRAIEAAALDTPTEVEVVRTIIDSRSTRTFVYAVTLGEFTGNANTVASPNPTALPAAPPSGALRSSPVLEDSNLSPP